MTWTNICQGLLVLGFAVRWLDNVLAVWTGRKLARSQHPVPATIIVVVYALLAAVVFVRAGAFSTIVGYP
jgi:hypothetical protein